MKKFTNWLLADKWLWFAIGLAVAAFFGISLGMRFVFCPAFFAAFALLFYVKWTSDIMDWRGAVSACLGGALAQLFVVLGLWWHFFG